MKKNILLLMIVLSTLSSLCQIEIIDKQDITIGRNYVTNKDIKAEAYLFAETIKEAEFNTENGDILLKLDNGSIGKTGLKHTCHIGMFNINDREFRWVSNHKFSNPSVKMSNDIVICYNNNKSYRLDIKTGEKIWSSKIRVEYFDNENNIAIGYWDTKRHVIAAVDLTTGKTLWKRKMNNDFRLDKYINIDNETLLVPVSGLHYINIKDGSGWDFDAMTQNTDYSIFGKKRGNAVTSADLKVITNLSSDVLIDNNRIYYAYSDKLSCFDMNGTVLWTAELPSDMTSNSSLLINDDKLLMINKGLAYKASGEAVQYGSPFIAAFDITTGNQIYFIPSENKSDMIYGFAKTEDNLTLFCTDRMRSVSIADGKISEEKRYLPNDLGNRCYFIGNNLIVKTYKDTKFLELSEDVFKYLTGDNMKIEQDNKVDIQYGLVNPEAFKNNKYKMYQRGISMVLTDKNGTEIAVIDIVGTACIYDNILCNVNGNTISFIDLNTL